MQSAPFRNNGLSGLIAVLGLVALLAGLIVMILLPAIRFASWAILALGVILLVIAFVLDYRRVGKIITGRRGRFSAGATVMASTFIGIVLLVNAISISNYKRVDVTGISEFTLTSQTKQVLQKLDMPVKALAFFVPSISLKDDPYNTAGLLYNYGVAMLEEYKNNSNNKLTVEYIDPDEHPDRAREYGITQYQTIVFETKLGRLPVMLSQYIEYDAQNNPSGIDAEHGLTSAVLAVTGTIQKRIYFTIGHGEASISGDYSFAKENLLDNLYQVYTLDLAFTKGIPSDAAAVIIAAPQSAFSADEVNIIQNYLDNGGWLMILTNPNSPPELNQITSQWGITIDNGTIIDPSSYDAPSSPNMDSISVPRPRNFFGIATTLFPGAAALTPQEGYTPSMTAETLQIVWKNPASPLEMYSLIRTSQDSWLDRNFISNQKPVFDSDNETKGSLNIGFLITPVLSEETTQAPTVPDTRLIVYGDSDFAANQNFNNGGNGGQFLKSVDLLTSGKEQALISIERKVLPFRRLIVGPEATTFITYSSIGLMPVIILIIGGVIWWRRR